MLLDITGFTHDFVSMEEAAEEVKTAIEPLKTKVEDKFDEIAALVKEVTILASQWDTDTQFGVRLIDEAEQQQVSTIVGLYRFAEFLCFFVKLFKAYFVDLAVIPRILE